MRNKSAPYSNKTYGYPLFPSLYDTRENEKRENEEGGGRKEGRRSEENNRP